MKLWEFLTVVYVGIGGCRLVRLIPICCHFVSQLKYMKFGDGAIQANFSEKVWC